MATTRFKDHILNGTTAARPAASAVPVGAIYASSTDGAIYQSDGTSWGTWLAAPAAGGGGALTLISTVTLAATGAIDFTSIPGTYNDLILVGSIRTARAAAISNGGIRFNNDSGSNYGYQYLFGSGTTVTTVGNSSGMAYMYFPVAAASTVVTNLFTQYRLEIIGYALTTQVKSCLMSYTTMDSTSYIGQTGGVWANTAAINRITFWDGSAASGNFAAGSVVRLYGRT